MTKNKIFILEGYDKDGNVYEELARNESLTKLIEIGKKLIPSLEADKLRRKDNNEPFDVLIIVNEQQKTIWSSTNS